MNKYDVTEDEEEAALLANAEMWNLHNTNLQTPVESWRERLTKAKSEGYKTERCECGAVFLAFHHFTTCCQVGCPMRDAGPSILERIKESCGSPLPGGIQERHQNEL